MSINYIGEHLFPGELGNVFIWIAFFSSVLACLFYVTGNRKKFHWSDRIRYLARGFYFVHVLSILGVAAILYYIIFKHYFEYQYVWQYSSRSLPMKYIISCFWAGQEGSFLVWAVWQALIGLVLLFVARKWESGVMTFFSLSQVFVTSMLFGIQVWGWQIGSSPFELLRDAYQGMTDTIFSKPDYLRMITDGNGLNPLLENIWMTIHPPVLFLGYGLTLVPFSYALASLVKKEYYSWIRLVIPWILLSLTFLGAGILLGGAWAYISLTFGGFWAWDPVENSSLVPWMTLLASLHFLLIARRQHHALMGAYLFTALSYVLVLYASFLTRSGVLSDSSAHSFGDNGMTIQLAVFLIVYFLMMLSILTVRAGSITDKRKELLLSREFWMFIGSIIVVLAAFQIIFTTSIPVMNSIFGTHLAPPKNPVGFYNRWQLPYALLIAGFIGFSQFLNYDRNTGSSFLLKSLIPVAVSVVLTIPFVITGIVRDGHFILFLFFIWFSLIASLINLFWQTARPGNFPAILTHIGFAIFLMGVLLTFSNSKTISTNTSAFDLGSPGSNRENLVLMKGDTLYMGGFHVTYVDKMKKGNLIEYQVDFLKRKEGDYAKLFSLFPSVNTHFSMGTVYNPDTKHFLTKDYYTYISAVGTEPEYIVIKTMLNPYINILWLGSILLIIGFGWAFLRRTTRRYTSTF